MEIVVAVFSAVVGLFIFSRLQKSKADEGQRDLEIKSAVIETKVDNLKASVVESEHQEKTDVTKIEAEQKEPQTTESLVDFFVNRDKPQ
jgi:hypothetical protein